MNFKIINLSTEEETPRFSVNRNKRWVDYGDNNDYPNYLINLYHGASNKHKAIINRKVAMTTGEGIEQPMTQELIDFIGNSRASETIEEIAVRINMDYEICNGFALLVKWNTKRDKIVKVTHIPYEKCRLNPLENEILVSKDWSNWRKSENAPVSYKRFNPMLKDEYPTQIFYYTEKTVGVDYYTIPYYSSTINWIELDWEISNFHLSSIRNGFMPGFILNFATGIPTEEEMEKAYKEFERKYTGTNNAGKFILTFSEGTEQKPELLPIELNSTDDRFVMLHAQAKEEIFVGHQVTSPMLFGIRTEGQLGGRDEMLDALAIFQSTYISGKQKVIEDQLNKIAKFAQVKEPIKFKDYVIDFENIENIEE